MSDPTKDRGPRVLASTLRSVLILGGLACAGAAWLSAEATKDRDTLSRLAASAGRGVPDPLTTGTIGGKAASTRLDPCAVRRP